jgi:purine catabolism regulator
VRWSGVASAGRLLTAVRSTEEVSAFYHRTLGPLLALDSRQRDELYRTLDAYIGSGGSAVQAAKRLHTHRNTVLYRLERLNHVLQMDLRDPQVRFVVQLALHAGAVAGTGETTAAAG